MIPRIQRIARTPIIAKYQKPLFSIIPSQNAAYEVLSISAQILCRWNNPKKRKNQGSQK
jgi:hypothetical protein